MRTQAGSKAKKPATEKGRRELGSAELSRLWNLTETNIDGCRNAVEAGRFIPEVKDYFRESIEQVL